MCPQELLKAFDTKAAQGDTRKPQRLAADILQPHMKPLHALFSTIVENQGSLAADGVAFGLTVRCATGLQLGLYNLVPNSSSTKLLAVHAADQNEFTPPATKPAPWHTPFEVRTSDMLSQQRECFYLKTQFDVMASAVKWVAAQCAHYPQKQEAIRAALAHFEMPNPK